MLHYEPQMQKLKVALHPLGVNATDHSEFLIRRLCGQCSGSNVLRAGVDHRHAVLVQSTLSALSAVFRANPADQRGVGCRLIRS